MDKREKAMREAADGVDPFPPHWNQRIATAGADAAEARVVAWLRSLSGYPQGLPLNSPTHGEVWVLHRAADAIERGHHWRDA